MVGYGSTDFPLLNEEGYDGRTIRTTRYRYTEWKPLDSSRDTLVELYDLEQDPMEYDNLAVEPTYTSLVSELSERLAKGWRGELPPGLGN